MILLIELNVKRRFFVSLSSSISCSNINSTNLWTFIYERLLFVCFRSPSCVRRHSNGEERKNIEKLFIYRSRIEFIVTMTLECEICERRKHSVIVKYFPRQEWTAAEQLFNLYTRFSPISSSRSQFLLTSFRLSKPVVHFFSAGGQRSRPEALLIVFKRQKGEAKR